MSHLSEIEFAVIDEIYFPASFDTIVSNTKYGAAVINGALKDLLKKEFVYQMKYNEAIKDYERCLEADAEHVEQYLYVASKKGLIAHNIA